MFSIERETGIALGSREPLRNTPEVLLLSSSPSQLTAYNPRPQTKPRSHLARGQL